MSKELPYFRFTVAEWLNDDISFEDYATKGVFIDVCAFYWFKDCRVDSALLSKRFSDAKVQLNALYKSGILKVLDDQTIEISFLKTQYSIALKSHLKRKKAGKLGGKQRASNARALNKPGSSYKDKEKDKDKDKDKDKKIPTLNDFLIYAKTLEPYHSSFDFQIKSKWETWKDDGWKDGYGQPIKNWKNKIKNAMPHFKKDYSATSSEILNIQTGRTL